MQLHRAPVVTVGKTGEGVLPGVFCDFFYKAWITSWTDVFLEKKNVSTDLDWVTQDDWKTEKTKKVCLCKLAPSAVFSCWTVVKMKPSEDLLF